ncbi:hypothetical protein ASPWEDRAFT_39556 [Aspergillus wentii DTO 134E9]|uniref:Uncharacterized protein n=1 Tax=Aspergillus wentii DTO 134E9 TaxID=1073089 RepID=A0A1L9RSB3_ASPWE|nr:uncharacterized protein ASPWEDRAFT_39556 [Aspergillus wentii DTO 134E9]OJJ37815.1 hypothetical protein ASPWEDRAFT_39556 [Aspergillus wentii DTO 134E9]
MKDLREEILKWLHDIPVLPNGSQRVLGAYNWPPKLQSLSDALYTATIAGLGKML